MTGDDETPPVAADDFPEFAEPPRYKPRHALEPTDENAGEPEETQQREVDDVIARLRRERAEGKHRGGTS